MSMLVDGAENKAAALYADTNSRISPSRGGQGAEKTQSGSFAVDISGTVMDNTAAYGAAYSEHGKSIEDVMEAAAQEDRTAQRNYMAIMSNSMSDEDFAKLQREGFHPGSTDIETVVTIIDRMKVAMAKGGTEVAGYTDAVSDDALKEIAGSEAFAKELKRQFEEKNIPMTDENIAAVREAWDILTQTGALSDGNIKYMVENNMESTPENLYTAKYSSDRDGSRQGMGYYGAGVAGYYARKPDEIDFEKLRPQMEKVIEEAGYPADEENFEKAKWLVEKGIPLNEDTFSLLSSIEKHRFPVSSEEFMASAASALADGIDPAKADLNKKETYLEKAGELMEKTAAIEDKAADILMARDLPLTLRNLIAASDGLFNRGEEAIAENVHGRRMLEEVRLTMTVEVNLKLLRSGFQIETASLEKLVDKLREAENSVLKALTGQVDKSQAREKASLYEETLGTLQGIRRSPAAIVTQVSVTSTLVEVRAYGAERSREYERAGQSYETMMTAPRRDMGDSIQKAFRNVDDILESMNVELTDTNRRAVRILGYNSLEITHEAIRQVREKDELLSGVVREMEPGRVLNMIREGVNPLAMSLEELKNYLGDRREEDTAQEMESYSKFLYKMEKQEGISEEERSAYIGIYRLVRQIEKADDAAVGALWQTGSDFTLGNLLRAHRSSRRGSMDYSVDDAFGGVEAKKTGNESITSQIEKGFLNRDIPAGEEVEELLENAGNKEAEKEFDKMTYEQVRAAVKSEEEVLRHLTDYGQPVTAENLFAAEKLLKNPKEIWRDFEKLTGRDGEEDEDTRQAENTQGFLENAGDKMINSLGDRESARSGYESLRETIQDKIKTAAFSAGAGALDVKAMSMLYKQVTFMGNMAGEENYEIPARIGDTLTSINLKVIHSGRQESKVAIAFETELFGKTAAEFRMTAQGLSGLCICSRQPGAELLRENQAKLQEKLGKEGIPAGDIYFSLGDKLDLAEFSLKESGGRQSGDDSGTLYRTAKVFIGFVQETGMKKGSIVYEN
ncbi:MAG: DUF6240 domain-containing protein [Clostridium sp.]|nr:DUF6240 domain-containing protein [Clostridium sp.]